MSEVSHTYLIEILVYIYIHISRKLLGPNAMYAL